MWVKFLLLFFIFSFLFKTDHSFDQDLGRHLKLGEIILHSKNVPLTNLFSYTYSDFPFINSHWLFEVLVYLVQQSLGLQSLLIFKLVIILLAVWLILKIVPKRNLLLLPVGFIFLHTLRERPELRPEILSFLFTALSLFLLEKFTALKQISSKKFIYLLPLIQLIWVNSHIYFIVGLVLQAIFLIHLSYQYLRSHMESGKLKALLAVFGLSILASFINPSGIKGFLNPFTFNQNYGYTIVENQTMFFLESINFRNPNFLFIKLSIGIILLSILIVILNAVKDLKIKPRDPSLTTQDDKGKIIKNILLTGFGLALALMNVRSFPYLVFISLPAVLQNLSIVRSRSWNTIFVLITVPVLIYESFFYLNGDYYKYTNSDTKPKLEFKESGKKALDFVLENNLPQPLFNNFDIGSYITYRGWPKYKIFVDGRPGEYPKEFFQDVYIPAQFDEQRFKDLTKKHNFKTIIFSITDQTPWGDAFLRAIVKNPQWKIVYIDDFMIVLVKEDIAVAKNLKTIDISKLQSSGYNFDYFLSYLRLSLFLNRTGNAESAQSFAQKSLMMFPQSPLVNALFGVEVPNKIFW